MQTYCYLFLFCDITYILICGLFSDHPTLHRGSIGSQDAVHAPVQPAGEAAAAEVVRSSLRQGEEEDLQGPGPDHPGQEAQDVQLPGVAGPQDCLQEVCELDIIFNFEKAYFILDEFLLGGEAQETSKKNVLKAIEQADLLQEVGTASAYRMMLGPGSAYRMMLGPGSAYRMMLGPGSAYRMMLGPAQPIV
uniref:AP complex mu/sigma subunit domain-containing protein n=1 Tax=Gadus morhua TaxID=8049 RepID=A0A8C5B498_GADMO